MKLACVSWVFLLTFFLSNLSMAMSCSSVFDRSFEDFISRELLETRISQLAEDVRDTREGFFGPDSMLWEIFREKILSVQSPIAVILQLGNPAISQSITNHPEGMADPIARHNRTRDVIESIIFGDIERATHTVRRTHYFHTDIRGKLPGQSEYSGVSPRLSLWVLSTLVHARLNAFNNFVHPMSKKELKRAYEETKIIFRLFGIPEPLIPPTYIRFQNYMTSEIRQLEYSEDAIAIIKNLLSFEVTGKIIVDRFGNKKMAQGIIKVLPTVMGQLLPPQVAMSIHLPEGETIHSLRGIVRWALTGLPKKHRYRKAYFDAMERLH